MTSLTGNDEPARLREPLPRQHDDHDLAAREHENVRNGLLRPHAPEPNDDHVQGRRAKYKEEGPADNAVEGRPPVRFEVERLVFWETL